MSHSLRRFHSFSHTDVSIEINHFLLFLFVVIEALLFHLFARLFADWMRHIPLFSFKADSVDISNGIIIDFAFAYSSTWRHKIDVSEYEHFHRCFVCFCLHLDSYSFSRRQKVKWIPRKVNNFELIFIRIDGKHGVRFHETISTEWFFSKVCTFNKCAGFDVEWFEKWNDSSRHALNTLKCNNQQIAWWIVFWSRQSRPWPCKMWFFRKSTWKTFIFHPTNLVVGLLLSRRCVQMENLHRKSNVNVSAFGVRSFVEFPLLFTDASAVDHLLSASSNSGTSVFNMWFEEPVCLNNAVKVTDNLYLSRSIKQLLCSLVEID